MGARDLRLVALGSVPGACLAWRWGVQRAPVLPFGSAGAALLVNLIGEARIGYLAGALAFAFPLALALGIGFCGSLTTFSSWMLALALLQRQGHSFEAPALLLLIPGLGLLAAAAGYGLSRSLRRQR